MIQASILEYLDVIGVWHMRINSGAIKDFRGIPVRMAPAGTADILCTPNGRVCWLEVKAEKGRQTPDQIAFQEHVTRHAHTYAVCRSIEDVMEAIKRSSDQVSKEGMSENFDSSVAPIPDDLIFRYRQAGYSPQETEILILIERIAQLEYEQKLLQNGQRGREDLIMTRSMQLSEAQTDNTRLREALEEIKAYCHGEEEVNGYSDISDLARKALVPSTLTAASPSQTPLSSPSAGTAESQQED